MKKLYPFDITQVGKAEFCTRCGKSVRIICTDLLDKNNYFPIIALVKTSSTHEDIYTYSVEGRCYFESCDSPNDLFIVKEHSIDDLSDLEVGDQVWSLMYQQYGTIMDLNYSTTYPIKVKFGSDVEIYTSDGSMHFAYKQQDLFRTKVKVLISEDETNKF